MTKTFYPHHCPKLGSGLSKSFLACAFLPLSLCVACRSEDTGNLEPLKKPTTYPTHHNAVARQNREIREMKAHLRLLEDPTISEKEFVKTMHLIRALPVIEQPSYWTRLINNTALGVDRRRDCLVALFLRHVPAGSSLGKVSKLEGTSGWFNRTNIFASSANSSLSVRNRGECVYSFIPDVCRSEQTVRYHPSSTGAIEFSFSEYVNIDKIVNILNGTNVDDELRILDIGASAGVTFESE